MLAGFYLIKRINFTNKSTTSPKSIPAYIFNGSNSGLIKKSTDNPDNPLGDETMKKNNSAGKGFICAVFIIVLTGVFISTAMALKTGDDAPDFAVLDIQGIQRTLADYQGQVVIVNFWATYCPPCRQEKPSMEQLYQNRKDQGLQILAVSGEKKRSIERYLKNYPLSFTVLRDEKGAMHRSYGILSVPQSFVVDRHGTIVHVFFGSQDWTGLLVSEVITPLLAE